MSEHPAIVAMKQAISDAYDTGYGTIDPGTASYELAMARLSALIEEVERLRKGGNAIVEKLNQMQRSDFDARAKVVELGIEIERLRSRPVLDEAAEKRLREEIRTDQPLNGAIITHRNVYLEPGELPLGESAEGIYAAVFAIVLRYLRPEGVGGL